MDFANLKKIHTSHLSKLETFKNSFDELKFDKIRIKIDFYNRVDDLTYEKKNLKKKLIECRKCTSTIRKKIVRHLHSFPNIDITNVAYFLILQTSMHIILIYYSHGCINFDIKIKDLNKSRLPKL